MTVRLPERIVSDLCRVLSEIGIRAIKNGSVTLQFDHRGAFCAWRETVDRRVAKEDQVASVDESAHN